MHFSSFFSFFKKKVPPKPVVAIPVYRWPLEESEFLSLKVARRMLGKNHPVCFVSPESLILPSDFCLLNEKIVRFPDRFFDGTSGYNKMLMSEWFFRFFANDFTHLLIYQLDCLVFCNDLLSFCKSGFSYFGAPWFKHFLEDPTEGFWAVGNGGLSLRNLESSLQVFSTQVKKGRFSLGEGLTANYVDPHRERNLLWKSEQSVSVSDELPLYPYNEDLFWSFEAPLINRSFRVAPPKKALRFSFEKLPRWCFRENGNRLPFGCHAWQKNDPSFWVSHLIGANIVAEDEIPKSLLPKNLQQLDAHSS